MSKPIAINELHGKVIDYLQIKNIPMRNAFLDQKIHKCINDDITTGKPLLFMPNDLFETHLQEKKYDKAKYTIVLFGVLLDGRRATVVVTGIKPYFEIMLPVKIDSTEINTSETTDTMEINTSELAMSLFNDLQQKKYACPESFKIIKGRKFKGYHKDKRTFVKFYFNKLKTRCEAIKELRSKGYETTSDDTSSYYRMVCRDYLTSFSSWVNISEYNIKTYTSIRGPVYSVDIKNYKICQEDITENPLLAKDNIMTVCWDIETYSPDGQLPKPEDPTHKMFMIGLTFQWHHANDQLLRVCLVEHPCKPRPNYLTVVCGDEKKLIKAFGKIIFKMKPEYFLGFNDSDYDWPWLVKRGSQYPGVLTFLAGCFDSTVHWKNYDDKDIMSYNFKKEKVKLEADAYADGYSLVFPGYINIDVRTIFRQLYPTAEKSNLNFYLALNKLGGKKDMPYQELFQIYRELNNLINRCGLNINEYSEIDSVEYDRLTEAMAEIADYCVIDSQRCHELMKIRSVIMDRREVAVMSYTTMFDSLYRANGMKVRNLVIARGQKFGIKFSNITNGGDMEGGKYPGAYVFPPKKGLVTSKLTMQERIGHALLMPEYAEWITVNDTEITDYKKIIDEYGACVSQDTINTIYQLREKTNKNPLRKCFIDFLLEPTGRPITGLDFSSLYPSLIMTYNLSPEYIITNQKDAKQAQAEGHNLFKIKFIYNGRIVRGWSIRHDNKLNPDDNDYKFGVYPMILKELFDARTQMKKGLHKWESEKERIDALSREEFMKPDIQAEYENVCFNYRYIDSKQRALKVFMNTFYGESGNKRSPFFVLQLAGAITTAGQDNIKMVQQFVESELCCVMYGDTDSLYISMPEKYFDILDRKYFTGCINKTEYWTEQVNITFNTITPLKNGVNNMLKDDNGTDFLKMAFEESLYPVAFLAKKKYYGIPHISQANFQPKELFIRGLEVKKRGVSEVLKKVCMNIMWGSVSLDNVYTLMQLVEQKIDEIYATKWNFKDFIMTDVYKPTKKNVKVQTFVARMANEGIVVKPYDRFSYVIVQRNPFKYDERGRKKLLQIGEKMEYAEIAEEKKMMIDLDYYMKGSINGQLARLITYYNIFQVEPTGDDVDDLKTAEDKTYANACKYIENYCGKYYTNYKSKGKIYQKIFRMANSVVVENLKQHCGSETVSLLNSNYDIENLEEWLDGKAEKDALKTIKNSGKEHVQQLIENLNDAEKKKKINELQDMYFSNKKNNLLQTREKAFKERQLLLQRQLRDNLSSITNVLKFNTDIITKVSNKIKNVININESFNEADIELPDFESIAELKNIDDDELNMTADYEIGRLMENEKLSEALNKLRYLYINMLSNYNFIHKTRYIVDYLKIFRNKTIGFKNKPKEFDTKKYIKDNVDDILNEIKIEKF